MKAVSGFIMCRNEAPFIKHAVSSLLPCCDDIFIIDMGSTDGTLDALADISSANPIIRIEQHKQRSQVAHESFTKSSWLNYAAERCLHDWVVRIDGDEYLQCAADLLRLSPVPLRFPSLNITADGDMIVEERLESGNYSYYPAANVRFYNRNEAGWSLGIRHNMIVSLADGKIIDGYRTDALTWHYHALYKPRKHVVNKPGHFFKLPLSLTPPVPLDQINERH